MSIKEINITGSLDKKLSRLYKPPQKLFQRGTLDPSKLLERPMVGVVGTRTPTEYGKSVTHNIVSELVKRDIVVVSGLALGIDGLAHKACMAAGGKTIAVLPSGIERVYPASHAHIAQQIEQGAGLLLSEYPSSAAPRADQFIARNRIIAALSDVLVIPEAAERSGSLHTANFALEMNIPLLAVPGNITSRLSAGTNRLIAQGAQPVLEVKDILDALGLQTSDVSIDYVPETAEEAALLAAIDSGLQDGFEIKHASELATQIFLQTLTMLEIKGVIAPLGGDKWRRT